MTGRSRTCRHGDPLTGLACQRCAAEQWAEVERGRRQTTCGRCGKTPAEGFAEVNGVRYCHGDEPMRERATCYEDVSSGRSQTRRWDIVVNLAGRDEDGLMEQVERLLCPSHDDEATGCAVPWFSASPADDASPPGLCCAECNAAYPDGAVHESCAEERIRAESLPSDHARNPHAGCEPVGGCCAPVADYQYDCPGTTDGASGATS